MRNRKETAWKKSRKFGDVKGGRTHPKLTDRILYRKHSLLPPAKGQPVPIFISENPSRDFFFPISIEEIKATLKKLPKAQTESLTHIWLRKLKKKDYDNGASQAYYTCGSGVNLITIHPFPRDLKMRFGNKKPSQKVLKQYTPYTTELIQGKEFWYLKWTEPAVKRYFLEHLLPHEIGHHIDSEYKRFWSKTYKKKKGENFANTFAQTFALISRTSINGNT